MKRLLQNILLSYLMCSIFLFCIFQDSVGKLLERNELDHLDLLEKLEKLEQKVHK